MNLKIGSRVKVVKSGAGGPEAGAVGKIVCLYGAVSGDYFWGVEFKPDQFNDGHPLDMTLPAGSRAGWYLSEKEIKEYQVSLENK